MFAPTSEQTGRFDTKVSNFLLATVKEAMSVRSLELVFCLLELLLLGGGQGLLLCLFCLKILEHRAEVTEGEFLNLGSVQLTTSQFTVQENKKTKKQTGG